MSYCKKRIFYWCKKNYTVYIYKYHSLWWRDIERNW